MGGSWILVECRQALFDDVCQESDGDAADQSREKQHREVAEDRSVLKEHAGCQKLPQIVGHSAGHADAHHAEKFCAVEDVHDDDAQYAAREGVDHAEDSAEEESRQQDPGRVDGEGVPEVHADDGDQYHQIGQPQLDARYGHGQGDQELDVTEDQGQRREHGADGNQTGAAVGFSLRRHPHHLLPRSRRPPCWEGKR